MINIPSYTFFFKLFLKRLEIMFKNYKYNEYYINILEFKENKL